MNLIFVLFGIIIFLFIGLIILIFYIYKKNIFIQELTTTLNEFKIKESALSEEIKFLRNMKEKFYNLEIEMQNKNKEIVLLKEDNSKNKAHLQEKEKQLSNLMEENNLQKDKNQKMQIILQEKEATIATFQTTIKEQKINMEEKFKLLQENKEKLTKEFHSIATEILDKNSEKFAKQNEKGVKELLAPLNMQINEFKKRVEHIYDQETQERGILVAELKSLKLLNERIGKDAINLTNALKGQSKQQGIWGEMILEKVLENSGLRKGVEYEREVSLQSENNQRFRPDVIVKLPGNREIIIDAKTSLVAYEQYNSCDDNDKKNKYLLAHLQSIKEHIKELSSKDYEKLKGINSLDFIFMFIPVEGALMLALQKDPNLYEKAFKEHIILVSPTTLLVALRAVENSWRYEKQARNIKDVTKRAEALYNKFVGFTKDFELVGKSIKKSEESYNEAFKKLSTGKGNIIRQITLFKESSNISPKNEISEEFYVE